MADGLFDNRYRYDYIYPRGRSGETLRALDTLQNERPVVIKRPAPNDAPPIRAGQEVSILNERKALTRLAGHSVLTEFLGDGQFFVSGIPHQYIVMERAEGVIVADFVSELARQGERLPQLEMLVIIDHLLDLLQLAHSRDIVYNDVDAKHLFWSRDTYCLKLIDWGNAIFLEGDEATPQGISPQSDILQVGELLYYIMTGGRRAEVPRDAPEDYQLNFGEDSERVAPRLQALITKAVHPNTRLRYKTVADLRRDLTDYRLPIERERDTIVNHVTERLRRELSKDELRGLLVTLEPALTADPGFPQARNVHNEINDRLRDLDVSADLDAVRLYMDGGNWSRAADLLHELRDKAGSQTGALVELLLDCCLLLVDSTLQTPPPAVLDAITLIFEGHGDSAVHTLLTQDNPSAEARKLQWLLAERISARIPEVLLLRPNLYRLELALSGLAGDGVNLNEARDMLAEIQTMLDHLPGEARINLAELRDGYRDVVDRMTTLNKLLATVVVQRRLPDRKLPLTSLDRALNAAMALADNMHVIGRQAASSPRDALGALDSSQAIDPGNPLWTSIAHLLDNLYELLQLYQVYVPAADGTDLEGWLTAARKDLLPFVERLFDEILAGMVDGLEIAAQTWADYMAAVVRGDRLGAVTQLVDASDAVGTISPTLAGWFNQLHTVIDGARYIERHAVHGGLGRALADGWEAFDRGRLADAERLGQQAVEISRNEIERFTARRLLMLAGTMRDWVERNGAIDQIRTQAALESVDEAFAPEEATIAENFAAQMPSKDTYLRAMNKGLVELYARSSTAALRLFFFRSVLLGTLEAHDANLDDAEFWQEVAARVLPEQSARHIAIRTLDEFIERRRDLNNAADLLNKIVGTESLLTLDKTRRQLEENSQARLLAAAIHSLRELETGLRDWADGEFRAAGLKIENTLKALAEAEQNAVIQLGPYRGWLNELEANAAELHNLARQMRQAIERRPAEPVEIIGDAHQRQAEVTTRLLGERYAAQLVQWRDTYQSFVATYTDSGIRRSARLAQFNELFRAMFIDRHPAYSLYRHWYDLTEHAPEFPAPPTDDPTPRIDEAEVVDETEYRGSRYADDEEPSEQTGKRRRISLSMVMVIVLLVLAMAVIMAVILTNRDADGTMRIAGVDVVVSATPDATSLALAVDTESTAEVEPDNGGEETTASVQESSPAAPLSLITPTLVTPATTVPRETESPAFTNTPAPPTSTFTPAPPTATFTPSLTPTATITPTPTLSPTPTLPPEGLQGWQELLPIFSRMAEYPWNTDHFAPGTTTGTWRLGVGGLSPGEQIMIMLPPETLDLYYGNDAPSRIRRTDATLALTTYDPALLDENDVYFGILLQSADDESVKVGLHIQVVNLNVLNLWLRQGDELTFISQRSVNNVIARVRLERDPQTGSVTAFFNDAQVGQPMPFVRPDEQVQPAIFVKDGGVIVSVANWRVGLR
jgi:hypothetical protein